VSGSSGDAFAVEPGQVWWCDGAALSFEAHFKRRPVLVLGVRDGEGASGGSEPPEVVVAPLSSRRRFGQEQAVTHAGGVSFLTGHIAVVARESLLKPLGAWDGFGAWAAEQKAPPSPPSWLARLFRRVRLEIRG
jgi:hypothetical protein